MATLLVIVGARETRLLNLDNVISGKRSGDVFKLFTTGANGGGVEVLNDDQVELFMGWLKQNAQWVGTADSGQ